MTKGSKPVHSCAVKISSFFFFFFFVPMNSVQCLTHYEPSCQTDMTCVLCSLCSSFKPSTSACLLSPPTSRPKPTACCALLLRSTCSSLRGKSERHQLISIRSPVLYCTVLFFKCWLHCWVFFNTLLFSTFSTVRLF